MYLQEKIFNFYYTDEEYVENLIFIAQEKRF